MQRTDMFYKVDMVDIQFTSEKTRREMSTMTTINEKDKLEQYSGKGLAHAILSNEERANLKVLLHRF